MSDMRTQQRPRPRLNRLWKLGAKPLPTGPFHVSMNDYWTYRWVDVPRIAWVGMRFRHRWPETEGAIGLWFAVFNGGRRSVSISVWRSPEDLRGFVQTPLHRRVMRDFRDAGSLITTTWTVADLDRHLIWEQAEDRLMGRVDGVPHH